MIRSSRVGLLLALALCTPAAAADEPLRLPLLSVQGSAELPAISSSRYAYQELAPAQLSLAPQLALVPGVFAGNRENYAQGLRLSIRGFGSRASFGVRGVKVLLDGVPLTSADGQTDLDGVDWALLSGLQLRRGPSSAQFGNAAGGVVALQSAPLADTHQALLQLSGGSHELGQLRLAGAAAAGAWRLGGNLLHTEAPGYRQHANYRNQLLRLRAERELWGQRLQLDWAAFETRALDAGALTPAQRDADRRQAAPNNLRFNAGELIRQQRLSATLSGVLAGQQAADWRLQLHGGQRDFQNRLPFENGGQVAFARDFGGLQAGLEWPLEWAGVPMLLGGGVDMQAQAEQRQRYDNLLGVRGAQTLDQREDARALGGYLQLAAQPLQPLELSASLRADTLKLRADDRFLSDGDDSGQRRFEDYSTAVAASWRLSPLLVLQTRYATAFESPTIGELANPAGGGFNPQLQAAQSRSLEFGARGVEAGFEYELLFYRIRLQDELLPFELAGQAQRTFYRNAGRSRRDGVELQLSWPLLADLQLQLAAALSRNRFLEYQRDGQDFAGARIPGMPERTASAALHWQGPLLQTRLQAQWVGERYADDANQQREPGYLRLDLALQGRLQYAGFWLRPSLAINNALGRDYSDNLRLNAFGGRYLEPAAPLTLEAAVALEF